jgi:archaemetzincin
MNMRTLSARCALLVVLFALWGGVRAEARFRLAVQPIGVLDKDIVEQVALSLRTTFDMDVEVLSSVPLPEEAYYRPRNRYRAEKILDYLDRIEPNQYDKVSAITASDISTRKGNYPDWGIFGLAYLAARPCVVSTYRLNRDVSRGQLILRLLKVARHEVGHTIGLGHCPAVGCVMQDANGFVKTVDSSDGAFCQSCASFASRYLLKNYPIGKRQ